MCFEYLFGSQVAQSATQAFSQAYEHAGCGVIPHEVTTVLCYLVGPSLACSLNLIDRSTLTQAAARAQKAAQMEEAKDAAGMAFQLAGVMTKLATYWIYVGVCRGAFIKGGLLDSCISDKGVWQRKN